MLAVLYDIHANVLALEAVLADAGSAGADEFLLGGDYALMGPWPVETLERLRSLEQTEWIRGNADRWAARPGDAPEQDLMQRAVAFCREDVGPQELERLAALPQEVEHLGARFCHASPVSDMRSFAPEPAADESELLAGVAAGWLVFGHTHVQFTREAAGGVHLLNPGSVGLPFDGDPRAAYALLHEDGRAEPRRVGYDHEAAAAGARERMGPWAETLARRLELARFDV